MDKLTPNRFHWIADGITLDTLTGKITIDVPRFACSNKLLELPVWETPKPWPISEFQPGGSMYFGPYYNKQDRKRMRKALKRLK
jgi:hypothetical protein